MNALRSILFFACLFVLTGICNAVSTSVALAETQYVSDLLIISVREGRNPDDPVAGYLRSATAVEVLEETSELMKVRAEDGLEGWVKKKFIVADKPKAVVIQELKAKISQLEFDIETLQDGCENSAGLQQQLKSSQQEIANLTDALENERQATKNLRNDLKKADERYQALSAQKKPDASLRQELADLKKTNQKLQERAAAASADAASPLLSSQMEWFLIGGGVLIVGFIIGRAIRRKRTFRY